MVGFEYKYTTSLDVIDNMKLLIEYSIKEYFILIISIIILLGLIYYILPIISIYNNLWKKSIKQKNRKKLIKQIAMQKDINDEIEKELNI